MLTRFPCCLFGVPSGATPLVLAASEGHEESVAQLLAFQADPNLPNKKSGSTPLMWCVQTARACLRCPCASAAHFRMLVHWAFDCTAQ